MFNMASMLQDQPFKNREHVKAEIRRCAMASSFFSLLSFLFVALGIISDALNTTLVLQPMIWLLLAIFVIHLVAAKHFLGIEAEG